VGGESILVDRLAAEWDWLRVDTGVDRGQQFRSTTTRFSSSHTPRRVLAGVHRGDHRSKVVDPAIVLIIKII
jgi:hypothetical protein